MLQHPYEVIVLSPRSLVRELLVSLLHARGIRRVAGCETPQDTLLPAATATMLVCDASAMGPLDYERYQESLRRQNPALRVVRLDDSSGAAAIAALLQPAPGRTGRLPHELLTAIEGEVMLGVAAGLRNVEIARRMRRSSKTIEKHRANALRKLGVRNVAQLTAYALRHRLLDMDSLLAPARD